MCKTDVTRGKLKICVTISSAKIQKTRALSVVKKERVPDPSSGTLSHLRLWQMVDTTLRQFMNGSNLCGEVSAM